ncbi:glutamate receptor ionotropic, kainate 2 isoform X2 [Ooceraea biroi]|uniref:glutamate receptor ionotropic, kainate 2 isoform X2 n=1 Tax=Ooceraea biroi TaxID=2015173 RepID=UPI0009716EFD|nr:glutamate receptor ionotropic, kainate 2 isoform X2 [Ooceraea biroi]
MEQRNASEKRKSIIASGWLVKSDRIIDQRDAIARWKMHRCKLLDLSSIWSLIALVCMVMGLARGQLIRPVYVYEGLIKGIHDYFNNTCIILLHTNPSPVENQGLIEGERLLHLQKYLSSTFHIRTALMDFNMFRTRIGQNYYNIKRPLFVLLNDYEDTRKEFANVSTWIAMAYPTWLVFFKNETKLSDFFFEIYVPFDCKFMVAKSSTNETGKENITEVYQVDKGKELRSMHFGTWDVKNGLKGPTRGLYFRRNDLFGHNIFVTSVYDPPISLFKHNRQNEITGMSGFFGEVILLLQEGMNCTFTYKKSKSWGVCLPNGTCTGAVGMLMNGKADFAATEFMMTSDRLDVISFTTPIYTTKCRTYIKRPSSTNVKWNVYTAPFSLSIWNIIIFFIIIMSGSIVLIQKLFMVTSLYRDEDHLPTKFTEILFFVAGAFCNQGMQQSVLDPIRMVHFVIHITAVIILAAYSAALVSFLTVQSFVMPFTTMKGLLKDKTYRFGVVGDSADFTFFQNTSDKVMNVLFTELLMKETDLPNNYLQGLKRVCKEDKYAFMTLDNMAALLQQKVNCKLEPLDTISQITVAMATRTNSPFLGLINTNLLLLRDGGILQRLMETQWSITLNTAQSSWKSVDINDVVPLLLLITAALLVSCFIYAIEHIAYKRLLKRVKLKLKPSRQLIM